MTAVKERIIGAVSIMSDKDADIFWHIIQKHFTAPDLFANIEEVEPDEVDLMMLKEIENNSFEIKSGFRPTLPYLKAVDKFIADRKR